MDYIRLTAILQNCVLCNVSIPTYNSISLNDFLLKGSVVQEELFSIILRFRKYKISFVADIQKMYRQIRVNLNQCNLQWILLKNELLEETKLYQLLTIAEHVLHSFPLEY